MRFIQAAVIAAAAAVAAAGAHAEFKDFTVTGQGISKDIQERQAQQGVAGAVEGDVVGQLHRQLVVGHGDRPAHSAMDDRDRAASSVNSQILGGVGAYVLAIAHAVAVVVQGARIDRNRS